MYTELNTKKIALTFDIEEWNHIIDSDKISTSTISSIVLHNVEIILELLESVKAHATFFILGSVAEKNPVLVNRINELGHEIGSHSYAHRLVYTQTEKEFREDFLRAKGILEGITGKCVESFRAPGFSINNSNYNQIMNILTENGIIRDSSIFPMTHRHGGMPEYGNYPRVVSCLSGNLTEYPITIGRMWRFNYYALGGGYFRLFPLALIERSIESLCKNDITPIVYLHPRDIDNLTPRVNANPKNRFMYYVNTRSAYSKLKYLIKKYNPHSLEELNYIADR